MTLAAENIASLGSHDPKSRRQTVAEVAHDVHTRSAGQDGAVAHASINRHRLLFEFALLNLSGSALLAAAYLQGWVGTILEAGGTGLTLGIFAVFVGGAVICARKLWLVTCELNCVRNFDPCRRSMASQYLAEVSGRGAGSRAITASALKVKLADRIVAVRHVANSLVLLGLIGTVLGFIIALSGVDPERAGDVRSVAPMVSELIRGMSVALYTTLVGSVLNLWLMVNFRVLARGAVRLATELIALGEANARPRVL